MSITDDSAPSPDFLCAQPKKLSLRYTWLCCLVLYSACAFAIFSVVVLHIVHDDINLLPLLDWYGWVVPIIILLTLYTIVGSRAKAYLLAEHHLSFYTGVLFKSIIIQPFSRLQHIEISRGPLQRVLGLATLKLFSAGGAQHALAVPGLPLARAEQLRASILSSRGLAHEQ